MNEERIEKQTQLQISTMQATQHSLNRNNSGSSSFR